MKNFTFLLLVSILFQSCFSYKSIDYNNISIEKKQKVEINKLDRTSVHGQLISKNEIGITLENNGELQTILKDEIYDVKVKKLSILKSLRMYSLVGAIAAGIILNTL